ARGGDAHCRQCPGEPGHAGLAEELVPTVHDHDQPQDQPQHGEAPAGIVSRHEAPPFGSTDTPPRARRPRPFPSPSRAFADTDPRTRRPRRLDPTLRFAYHWAGRRHPSRPAGDAAAGGPLSRTSAPGGVIIGGAMEETYFRRGFGLKKVIEPIVAAEYHSAIVDELRARGYTAQFGDVTIRLAEQFGFCYGVDRAVDYAYETAHKFPDKRIFLVGEIIHNPHVNQRMREMGITFLYPDGEGRFDFSVITPDDVVILPAFGVTIHDFRRLREIGCILVDTTCGSVLNVWKRVESYARDGFTALIHGKYTHEESRATASQVLLHPGGKYIIVRDMAEARLVCDYIEQNENALSREAFQEHFRKKATEGFDPDADLVRIGVANQTTMLA